MPFFRELTEFEKIDRIYTNLERQKWSRRIGILTRIVLILGLYYGYHWINQPENAQIKAEITQRAQQKLAEFIAPLVQDLMKTVLANMGNMGEWSLVWQEGTGTLSVRPPNHGSNSSQSGSENGRTQGIPTITPEMIQAVQQAMQK